MLVEMDDATAYGEGRFKGVAPYGTRLFAVVFTPRDEDTVRIISLRRASNSEIHRYESQDTR
ncbi:MAG: BrnT family toxin [Steroidobacteraceae bacterium]